METASFPVLGASGTLPLGQEEDDVLQVGVLGDKLGGDLLAADQGLRPVGPLLDPRDGGGVQFLELLGVQLHDGVSANGLLAWNEAAQSDPSLNCALTADINMTGKEWTPVGMSINYSGTFDGQGHSITGLAITTNSTGGENAVLFGSVGSNGTVKNLQLKDVNCDVQQNGVAGGIANSNYGTITACSVTGEIKANNGAAGGIAVINFGTITACWFDGNLTTSYDNGGIAAYNYSTITTCFYGGNAGHGAYNQGGTIDATKVEGTTTWQTAVGGMNAALTGNDYQWKLGANSLPVLQKNQ